jgi:N-acyl-D-amino-acid deacylase
MLFSGMHLQLLLWILTWIALIVMPPAPVVFADDTDPLPSLSRLVKEFMVRHQVPGASLAITRNNLLIYAEGFGYADREHRRLVSSRSLFRIASVSKPFTATAILQLVEQDRFRLDDPVLPLLKPTLRDAPGVPGDPRLQSITIRHLLQHRAGWDRAQSRFFPLRSNSLVDISRVEGIAPPGTPDTVVRYMLTKPLDYTPGARYAYANIGYLVLGRVIESITGQSYASYVNKHLLVPLGILDMRIGSSTRESSAPGEVCYYTAFDATIEAQFGPHRGQKVPVSYNRSLEVQEAAGGWIASVVDLARFVTALYAPEDIPPLKPETLREMITATPPAENKTVSQKSNGYALGWYVEHDGQGRTIVYHTGHLPGTGAFMGRRSDGIGVAVLFNSDTTPQNDQLIRLFLADLAPAIDSLSSWPQHDLFPIYFPGKQSN